MSRIKPFGQEHALFESPTEAIEFFENNAEREDREIPSTVRELLAEIAEYDPEATWAVQTTFPAFITVARAGDRRPWLFAKPESVAIWVAFDRNAEALADHFDDLIEEAGETSKPTPFVRVNLDAVGAGAMCAISFAAIHSAQ